MQPYHRQVDVPLLVVVTGMPSSGKTTIAESLAERLRLPLIAKDDLKESLFESLGAGDVAWSSRLGSAAYNLIFELASRILAAHVSMIVEANFFVDQQQDSRHCRGIGSYRFTATPRSRCCSIATPRASVIRDTTMTRRSTSWRPATNAAHTPPCRCPASSFGSRHASLSRSTSSRTVCGHCSSRAADGKRAASEPDKPRVVRTRSESTRYFS